jgi:hypothetical protein
MTDEPGLGLGLTRRRRLSLLLEVTQAFIALSVTGVTLYVSMKLALATDSAGATASELLLSNAFFLVVGFYFGRTNQRQGQRATDQPDERPTGVM